MPLMLLLALPAAMWLASGPAQADSCLVLIERLEAVLERVALEEKQNATALVTSQGSVEVTTRDGGALPQENWFGDPAGRQAAVERLNDARRTAEAGEEATCMAELEELQAAIGQLGR